MHDIKIIRNKSDIFLKKLEDRNVKIDLGNLLKLDELNRKLIQTKEKLEQEKKIISKTKDKSQFEKSKTISREIESLDKIHNKLIHNERILRSWRVKLRLPSSCRNLS